MSTGKRFSAQQKVEILREHLENQISIGDLAERYGVSPSMIYKWKKSLFEGALTILSNSHNGKSSKKKKEKNLEEKLQQRDSLISELVSENITLKKSLNGDV